MSDRMIESINAATVSGTFDSGDMLVIGENIASVWERSILEMMSSKHTRRIPTEYDREGDPLSYDVSAVLIVNAPMSEPRVHRCMPAGIDDLLEYSREVVLGTKDHLVSQLGYTYHDRLVNYKADHGRSVNQLDSVVEKLKKVPYSRRAQAITWVPGTDNDSKHPPCLQRLWFRVVNGALDMSVSFRSNDAFKAAFMNMYVLTILQMDIALRLGVRVGTYRHYADSYHIYGSYTSEVESLINSNRSFSERTWTTDEVIALQYAGRPTVVPSCSVDQISECC
jgi:thymidylate synthase